MVTLILFVILILIIIGNICIITNTNKEEIFNYSIKNYQDLLNDFNNELGYTIGDIPKIIIKTSWQSNHNFPQQILDVLEINKKLNPDWDIYYFDDDDVDEFMKKYSSRAFHAYKKLIPGAFKADLFRYCFLENTEVVIQILVM